MSGADPRPLPYGRQDISAEDRAAVEEVLRSDWLTQGPTIARFEAALCEATSARYAVAVSNGTAALHLAVLAAGIGPGDVGILPPITFLATANALRYVGATAAFADVDPGTGLIDPASAEQLAHELRRDGRNVRALLPVDLAGAPAPMGALRELGRRLGAVLIEDAAHALGATLQLDGAARRVGGMAELTTFSFHPVKLVTTGEGGAITTDREDLDRALRQLRSHGMHTDPARLQRPQSDPFRGGWYYEQDLLGFNYRLTDLQAALGLSQLGRLDAFLARRGALAAAYERGLMQPPLSEALVPLEVPQGARSARHLFVVRLRERDHEPLEALAERRRALFEHMRARKILVQVHYIPVHWQPFHAGAPTAGGRGCPNAVRYYASCLSLPLFPAMADGDVDRVLQALADFFGSR